MCATTGVNRDCNENEHVSGGANQVPLAADVHSGECSWAA